MIRKMIVVPDMIVNLCQERRPIVIDRDRLPEDARCEGVEYDRENDRFFLLVSSSVFRPDDPEMLPSTGWTEFPT